MVRNTVKNGQSWCSAVICRKRSAFDMQFHLIVVSISEEEQFPVPRYTAASKIGNSVISLL